MKKAAIRIDLATNSRPQAVLYARVSSKEQEKEGFNPFSAEAAPGLYGATEGLRIAHEYVDIETAKIADRANFGAMVTHLKTSPSIRVLLVEKKTGFIAI